MNWNKRITRTYLYLVVAWFLSFIVFPVIGGVITGPQASAVWLLPTGLLSLVIGLYLIRFSQGLAGELRGMLVCLSTES